MLLIPLHLASLLKPVDHPTRVNSMFSCVFLPILFSTLKENTDIVVNAFVIRSCDLHLGFSLAALMIAPFVNRMTLVQ